MSHRILFIDDEPLVRKAFTRSLRDSDYHVDVAATSEEALALALQNTYAVIATDLNMPDTPGDILIAEMRVIQPHAAYIMITGNLDRRLPALVSQPGAVTQALAKPWGRVELLSTLSTAVGQHLERVALAQKGASDILTDSDDSFAESFHGARNLRFLNLLRNIEDQGEFTGCIEFIRPSDRKKIGYLLLNHGRICVVGGTQDHAPLGEMLVQCHPEPQKVLQEALIHAREEGKAIGEVLTQMGVVSTAQLADALRKQVNLGLQCIADETEELDTRLSPLRSAANETLSFSLGELYFSAMRRFGRLGDDLATDVYHEFVDIAENAVLVAKVGRQFLPLLAKGWPGTSIYELRQLANATVAMAMPPTLLAAQIVPRVVAAGDPKTGGIVISSRSRTALLGGLNAVVRNRMYVYIAEAMRREKSALLSRQAIVAATEAPVMHS